MLKEALVLYLMGKCLQNSDKTSLKDLTKLLPVQIPYLTKKAIYTEFVKSISSLKRIKLIVTGEERALTLIKTRVLCLIA